MGEEIVVGGTYRHFRGPEKIYEVVELARDCDNPAEIDVIYKQLYSSPDFPAGTVWRRSLEDFCGYKTLGDGTKVKRFTLVKIKQS